MRKLTLLAFVLLVSQAEAQITETPIKAEEPAPPAADNPDAIVFPPATEPYKPVDVKPPAQQHEKPLPLAQPQPQPAMQPQPVQTNFNTVPPTTNYGMSGFATRETIERPADSCKGELSMLWQQKRGAQGEMKKNFDLAMGEAKVACDALQEQARVLKTADQNLSAFQESLRRAQGSLR